MCACRKSGWRNFLGLNLAETRVKWRGVRTDGAQVRPRDPKRVRSLETRGRGVFPTLSPGRALPAARHYCGFECS